MAKSCAPVRRPQCNGFVEWFRRTLFEEHVGIQGREKFFETLEEMQKDLDGNLVRYKTGQSYREFHVKKRKNGPHEGFLKPA